MEAASSKESFCRDVCLGFADVPNFLTALKESVQIWYRKVNDTKGPTDYTILSAAVVARSYGPMLATLV